MAAIVNARSAVGPVTTSEDLVFFSQADQLVVATPFLLWQPAAAVGGVAQVSLPQHALMAHFIGRCDQDAADAATLAAVTSCPTSHSHAHSCVYRMCMYITSHLLPELRLITGGVRVPELRGCGAEGWFLVLTSLLNGRVFTRVSSLEGGPRCSDEVHANWERLLGSRITRSLVGASEV